MFKNKYKYSYKYLKFGLIGFIFILIILLGFSNQILTKNQPICSETLVIEGWLPAYYLEMIPQKIDLNKYKTLFVTGIAHKHPEYLLNESKNKVTNFPVTFYRNGSMVIDFKKNNCGKLYDSIFRISIYAYGSKAMNKYASFFISLNDSIIGYSFVEKYLKKYEFNVKLSPNKLRSISLYFNNDLKSNKEDRNLIIDSVLINEHLINLQRTFKIYDDQINQNLYANYCCSSNAILTAKYLKILGVKNEIILVDTFFNERNKTLAAARKFEYYICSRFKNIKGFNVVSINKHSRRSYLAYKIATGNKKKVGIISLDDAGSIDSSQTKSRFASILEEYFKLFITSTLTIHH